GRGRRVDGFALWDGPRRLARIGFASLDSPFPFLLDVPQQETERLLRRHLESFGVHVEQSTELTGLRQSQDDVEVTLRRPDGSTEREHARYVVGCDGARSTVRRAVGLAFDGHGYPHDWLLADLAMDWDRSPDDVHVVFNPSGHATVFMPLSDRRWRVILYFAGDRAAAAGPPTLDEVAALIARRIPGRITVSDPSWLATFRTHRRSASSYRRGRVLLAGDAVHIHSPAGGQGLNVGLQDADNLAWKLAAVLTDGAAERLLDSYQAEREPVARQVLDLSHNLVRLSSLRSPWQRAARSVAVPAATRLPTARDRAARRISQLHVTYRGSPALPSAGRHAGWLRPGDRAPDARGLLAGGRPTTLHRLLRGHRHTLLILTDRRAAMPPADVVTHLGAWARQVRPLLVLTREESPAAVGIDTAVDHAGEVCRAYPPGLHLVRPDGYLAASGPGAVRGYLRSVYGELADPDTWVIPEAHRAGPRGYPGGLRDRVVR
ncbi:MAG: FAD-dependent monooxygenase, partial [Actinomycetota bacterium]|nr:FAD-dependent monooxygenase [Actinomycetota bacterium]